MKHAHSLLIFSVALAPYRIDFFNILHNLYTSSLYFTQKNVDGSYFDANKMSEQCNFTQKTLKSRNLLGRNIPFGVLSIIKKEKPTCIFVPEFSLIAILVCLYKKIFRFSYKIFSICDDSIDMLNGNDFSRLHKYSRKIILPMLDNIILLDSQSCDWYKKHYQKGFWFPLIRNEKAFRKKLHQLRPASDQLLEIHSLKEKTILLFVGRLIKLKNIEMILQIMPELSSNICLIVIGEGEEKENLQNLANQLSIDVRFMGWKNDDNLLVWYNIAHILILPSFREAFGAVVNEALMAGCRVCVSSRAGSACLVNEMNGSTFDPTNLEDLKTKIIKQISLLSANKDKPSLMPVTFDYFADELTQIIEDGQ